MNKKTGVLHKEYHNAVVGRLRARIKEVSHWRDLWKIAATHYRKSFARLVDEKSEKFGGEAGRWLPRLIKGWIKEAELQKRVKELEGVIKNVLPLFEEMMNELLPGCDHEVGMCMCNELDLVERMKEALQGRSRRSQSSKLIRKLKGGLWQENHTTILERRTHGRAPKRNRGTNGEHE